MQAFQTPQQAHKASKRRASYLLEGGLEGSDLEAEDGDDGDEQYSRQKKARRASGAGKRTASGLQDKRRKGIPASTFLIGTEAR